MGVNWELSGSLLVVTSAHSCATIKSSERSEFKIKELMSIERTQFVQK